MPTPSNRRAAFTRWILHDRGATVLVPPAPTNGDASPGAALLREVWSIQELLHCLWDDPTPLPDAVREAMNLPAGATHAHAARLLTALHADDTFPSTDHGDVVTRLKALPPDECESYWHAVDQAAAMTSSSH